MSQMMDITPATLSQVVQGRGGSYIEIEEDVCNVAQRLKEIHSSLILRYNQQGNFFAVIQIMENGDENLVTTAQEADARLVERVRKVTNPSYDYGAELERVEAENLRVRNSQVSEQIGEISERLAHAVRSDLRKGLPGPVYIPPDLYNNTRRK